MKTALYAGSFEPFTNGHLEVVEKALKIFDKIVILVANNNAKKYTFSLDERVAIIKECFKDNSKVEVESTSGITVRKAKSLNIDVMIRGLRDVQDFEMEQRLYIVNQALDKDIETFYVMASPAKIFISSTNLKLMFKAGEDISDYVPKPVLNALEKVKDRI